MSALDALLAYAPPGAALGIPHTFEAFCEWVGFSPTPAQRALMRVSCDGHDPATDLERQIFGGAFHVPPTARREQVWRCGRRSAKTTIVALLGVYRMVTGDLRGVGRGDRPMVAVVSQDLSVSDETVVKALEFVRGRPELAAMLREPKVGSFILHRPDGRDVKFVTKVSSAGGKGARSHWWLLYVIDEAEFLDPAKPDAVASVAKTVAAARPGILPGGAIIMCTTPWPMDSYPRQVFVANYGHPVHALCVSAPTLLMRDGDPDLTAARDAAYATDPREAAREFDCVESDVAGAFFEASLVDAAISTTTPTARRHRVSVGIDLAFVRDSAGAVHVERQILGAKVMLVVTAIDMQTPQKHDAEVGKDGKTSGPMLPSKLIAKFVNAAREACADAVVADGHYIQSVREHASHPDVAMQVVSAPQSQADQSAADVYLRDLLREGLLLLPNEPRLVGQLKSVTAKAQPGGLLRMHLPRLAGAGHADLVVALRNAAWYDRRHGPLLRGAGVASNVSAGVPHVVVSSGWSAE